MSNSLKKLPLHAMHMALDAKMAPFAGYEMPVQYPLGVMKEHLQTRSKAGLFDVSHMGQARLILKDIPLGSDGAHEQIADAIETIIPGEIRKLKKGGLRYSVLLNDDGGILDDLMITRPARDELQGMLYLVVNAGMKEQDFDFIRRKLGDRADLEIAADRALLAVQGPAASSVIGRLIPGAGTQIFMTMQPFDWNGVSLWVSRCGYTGEDGFEISVPNDAASSLATEILANDDVEPIGLGARDSLRLEAGLCLYGHDLDEKTSPVEGNISFVIGKRRRSEGGFPGASRILSEIETGPRALRVGLKPAGRAPAREGTEIQSTDGKVMGVVTSGGFAPSLSAPIAMGYVEQAFAKVQTDVHLMVRGIALPAKIVEMPFVEHNYFRGA